MNRALRVIILTAVCLFLTISVSWAARKAAEDTFWLPKEQVLNEDLFLFAHRAVLDGTVNGDVYVMAERLTINGKVNGDVIALTGSCDIKGEVNGNVRTMSQLLHINGTVERNVFSFTKDNIVEEAGLVKGSILSFSKQAEVYGTVGKELNGSYYQVRISGTTGGTSLLSTNSLVLEKTAVINGNLTYSSPQRAMIAEGAVIKGTEEFREANPMERKFPHQRLFGSLLSLLSLTAMWLLLRYLIPGTVLRVEQTLQSHPVQLAGTGALVLLIAPIVLLLLFVTIAGIPIALILLFGLGTLLYVSKVFIGIWLGKWVSGIWKRPLHPLLREAIGVYGLFLLTQLPIYGWLITLAAWLLFTGAVFSIMRKAKTAEGL